MNRHVVWMISFATFVTVFSGCGTGKLKTPPPVAVGPASSPAPETVVLRWDDFDDPGKDEPANALYYLDDKPLGRGREGFLAVLAKLDRLSHVVVDIRAPLAPVVSSGSSPSTGFEVPPQRMPFEFMPDLLDKLHEVASKRHLALEYFY